MVTGELVHVYDLTNAINNPRNERIYALFDPSGFAASVVAHPKQIHFVTAEYVRLEIQPPYS